MALSLHQVKSRDTVWNAVYKVCIIVVIFNVHLVNHCSKTMPNYRPQRMCVEGVKGSQSVRQTDRQTDTIRSDTMRNDTFIHFGSIKLAEKTGLRTSRDTTLSSVLA